MEDNGLTISIEKNGNEETQQLEVIYKNDDHSNNNTNSKPEQRFLINYTPSTMGGEFLSQIANQMGRTNSRTLTLFVTTTKKDTLISQDVVLEEDLLVDKIPNKEKVDDFLSFQFVVKDNIKAETSASKLKKREVKSPPSPGNAKPKPFTLRGMLTKKEKEKTVTVDLDDLSIPYNEEPVISKNRISSTIEDISHSNINKRAVSQVVDKRALAQLRKQIEESKKGGKEPEKPKEEEKHEEIKPILVLPERTIKRVISNKAIEKEKNSKLKLNEKKKKKLNKKHWN